MIRYVAYTLLDRIKLASIESGAEVNVQSDWNQTDTGADDYIKNKPAILTPPRGGGYFTTAVSTYMEFANDDEKVNAVFTEWPNPHDIEWDATNNRFNYTGTGGDVLVVVVFSAANNTNNTKMTYSLCKNGTMIAGASATTDFINNNKDQRMGITATITLATNDYIEFCVEADGAGTTAYTSHCQMTIR